ncbi:hypothetical protein XO12_04025 [Marinitoga sp. 1154]|nr:hypothetical protein [Marinitoga sp. 1154]NUU99308.1 hypothetical protein [Marinitoga sp. 1154]
MKKVVIYAILLMMFVNMIPVNIFADSKVVNVKVLTNDEMKNIIRIDMPSGTRRDKLEVLAPRYVKINY